MGVLLVLAAPGPTAAQNTDPWPASGNVGIGTTTPATYTGFTTLAINHPTNGGLLDFLRAGTLIGQHRVEGNNFQVTALTGDLTFVTGGGGSMRLTSTGNVGIGTSTPGAYAGFTTLALNHAANGGLLDFLRAGMLIGQYRVEGNNFQVAALMGDLTFLTGGGGSMRLTSAGNVGVGTASPLAKLHVVGDAQVDGNLAAKYQDVAEWVQTPTPLPPGMVVVVDPHGRNRVLAASGAYDTRVAGVVSARPGLLLGEAGDDKVKVAHSGRVRVKVDASYGPVAVGDLLVTSPTAGHAMRSTPVELSGTSIHRPGTLLGKALEPLSDGQGEILVLLTLQ